MRQAARSFSAIDCIAASMYVALLTVSWSIERIATLSSRELALAIHVQSNLGELADQWGRPLRTRHSSIRPFWVTYSVGQNGLDEKGTGDDVTLVQGDPMPRHLNRLRWTICAFSTLLVGIYAAARLLPPMKLAREALCAVALSCPVGLATFCWCNMARHLVLASHGRAICECAAPDQALSLYQSVVGSFRGTLFLDPGTAASFTAWLLCMVLVLAFRSRQPRAGRRGPATVEGTGDGEVVRHGSDH